MYTYLKYFETFHLMNHKTKKSMINSVEYTHVNYFAVSVKSFYTCAKFQECVELRDALCNINTLTTKPIR